MLHDGSGSQSGKNPEDRERACRQTSPRRRATLSKHDDDEYPAGRAIGDATNGAGAERERHPAPLLLAAGLHEASIRSRLRQRVAGTREDVANRV
jgi:hypothetical protein